MGVMDSTAVGPPVGPGIDAFGCYYTSDDGETWYRYPSFSQPDYVCGGIGERIGHHQETGNTAFGQSGVHEAIYHQGPDSEELSPFQPEGLFSCFGGDSRLFAASFNLVDNSVYLYEFVPNF